MVELNERKGMTAVVVARKQWCCTLAARRGSVRDRWSDEAARSCAAARAPSARRRPAAQAARPACRCRHDERVGATSQPSVIRSVSEPARGQLERARSCGAARAGGGRAGDGGGTPPGAPLLVRRRGRTRGEGEMEPGKRGDQRCDHPCGKRDLAVPPTACRWPARSAPSA